MYVCVCNTHCVYTPAPYPIGPTYLKHTTTQHNIYHIVYDIVYIPHTQSNTHTHTQSNTHTIKHTHTHTHIYAHTHHCSRTITYIQHRYKESFLYIDAVHTYRLTYSGLASSTTTRTATHTTIYTTTRITTYALRVSIFIAIFNNPILIKIFYYKVI